MATETDSAPSSLEEALLAVTPEDDAAPPEDEQVVDEGAEEEPDDEGSEEDPGNEAEHPGSIFELAEELGLDLRGKYKDEQEALKGVLNAARLVGHRNELAEWGRLLHERPEQVLEVLQQRLGTKAAPKAEAEEKTPEPKSDDPDVAAYLALKAAEPAWDDDWEHQITRDKDGNLVPTADAEPGVMAKVRKYQAWEQKVARFVVKKPGAVMKAEGAGSDPKSKDEIKQLKAELDAIKQNEKLRESQQFMMQIAVQEKDWMFNGGQVAKGNLTKAGELFGQVLDALIAENPGTKNPLRLVESAKALVISQLTAKAKTKTAKPKAAETEEEPEEEPAKTPTMRQRLQGGRGDAGKRKPRFSASATGRGPAGSRAWPKVGGRDMTLAERLAQQMGLNGK